MTLVLKRNFYFLTSQNYKRRKIRGYERLICLIEKQYDFFVKF